MKFYRINGSSNRKEIGFDPQIEFQSGTKEIKPHEPLSTDITTSFKTNAGAKLTDFMRVSYPGSSFVVSSKAKEFLEELRLPEHQFLNLKIEGRKEIQDQYYYFHVFENNFEAVLYEESLFNIFLQDGSEEKQFKSYGELIKYLETKGHPGIFPKQLIIKDKKHLNFDFSEFFNLDVYPVVSESFKNSYEANKLTGLEFHPCPYLHHYK